MPNDTRKARLIAKIKQKGSKIKHKLNRNQLMKAAKIICLKPVKEKV